MLNQVRIYRILAQIDFFGQLNFGDLLIQFEIEIYSLLLLAFNDLNFEYLDLFMLFEYLWIKCLMLGCLLHPVAQFLNLLLFLRELMLRCADHACEAPSLQGGSGR
jgi:hypothetical protein